MTNKNIFLAELAKERGLPDAEVEACKNGEIPLRLFHVSKALDNLPTSPEERNTRIEELKAEMRRELELSELFKSLSYPEHMPPIKIIKRDQNDVHDLFSDTFGRSSAGTGKNLSNNETAKKQNEQEQRQPAAPDRGGPGCKR